MPKILIEVSDVWYERLRRVIPAAIDALEAIEYRITDNHSTGQFTSEDLIDQISEDINQMRRNLETIKIIF